MQNRRVPLAESTAGALAFVLLERAGCLLFLATGCAPSSVQRLSAQPWDAKPTQGKERKDFVGSIPKTRRPDLLQAAATALLHEDFAARMVHGSSARLVAATKVLAKLLCARSMVPKRSACLTIARLPLLQGDCASDRAVAAQRRAT